MNSDPQYTKEDIQRAMAQIRMQQVIKLVAEKEKPIRKDSNDWGLGNTLLEAVWWATNIADAATTTDALRRGIAYEANPLLGKHPKPGRVWGTALAGGAMHTLGSSMLDEPYRTIYQGLTGVLKGLAVNNNLNIGAKFKF